MQVESSTPWRSFGRVGPYAAAYLIALLPVGVFFAVGAALWNRTHDSAGPGDGFDMGAVDIFFTSYLVGLILSAPGFALLRWLAGRFAQPGPGLASMAGALLGAGSFLGLMQLSPADVSALQALGTFVGLGAVCGALYWGLETYFTRDERAGGR